MRIRKRIFVFQLLTYILNLEEIKKVHYALYTPLYNIVYWRGAGPIYTTLLEPILVERQLIIKAWLKKRR